MKEIQKVDNTFLFTFIMDYAGGCYISQVRSEDEVSALRIWLKQLEVEAISKEEKDKLIEQNFEDETPTLIRDSKNVWCSAFTINKKKRIALINIIKTLDS